jgi:hypothetical protein
MYLYLSILLGMLALVAGLLYRARLTSVTGAQRAPLSDDLIRQIEESGYVELDEPLDHEQIQEEEARFWDDAPWEETEDW